MDFLSHYTPTEHSDSSDDPSSETQLQTLPPPSSKTLVSGTVEHVTFDSSTFDAYERRHARVVVQPNLLSKRPRSPPTQAHSPKQGKSEGLQTPHDDTYTDLKTRPKKSKRQSTDNFLVPTSTLHIDPHADYQGRSWTAPPSTARTFAQLEQYTPYIPKQPRVTLHAAHRNGVRVVRFSPLYGHLLLSGGMDGFARVWNTERAECARDYKGHTKMVRDVCFMDDGTSFLTAGFDGSVKWWDIESGRVKGSYRTEGMPACVRAKPGEANEFLVACSSQKILQIDVRDARSVVQEYDQHMGGVNSITFVGDNRKFVSSADDKVLRVWEYGIPVVIKYVSDPTMHSMPVTLLHPNRKWLVCQSMDNNVLVYTAKDRFKQNIKKRFKGHLVAGYACGLTFSPDGRFIGSGDSLGRLFFWDWKSSRLFRTTQAHKGICIDLDWHPTKSSLVASCGWDGDIKLWD